MEIPVTRNGVTMIFTQEELTRGKNKGATIMAPPKIDESNVSAYLDWYGPKNLASILYGRTRTLASGWTDSAEDSEGNFQVDAFKTFAESFSARGEPIEELENQIDEKLAEMSKLSESGDSAGIVACAIEIKALKAEIESKKRPRKQKAEVANA